MGSIGSIGGSSGIGREIMANQERAKALLLQDQQRAQLAKQKGAEAIKKMLSASVTGGSKGLLDVSA